MAALGYYHGPSYEESVSQVTATNSVELGSRRWHQGEEYIYCYNAGSVSAPVRLGVRFVTAASGYSVAKNSSASVFNPLVAFGSPGWISSTLR